MYDNDRYKPPTAVMERLTGERLSFACAAHRQPPSWAHLIVGPYGIIELSVWP